MIYMITLQKTNTFFIQSLIYKGKKNTSELLFLKYIRKLKKRFKELSFDIPEKALKKVQPLIYIKTIKIKGSSYKIPFFIKKEEQQFKRALDWSINFAKNSKINTVDFLFDGIIRTYFLQGDLKMKSDEIHKLANQSKVYAHYKWF